MNVMNYKGYTAKIEFDPRDNIFWGKVLAIGDSITFEGSTVAELTADFHNAVDFYLADCTARGRSPQKPVSDKLLLRVPRRSTVPPWQPPRLPEPVQPMGRQGAQGGSGRMTFCPTALITSKPPFSDFSLEPFSENLPRSRFCHENR